MNITRLKKISVICLLIVLGVYGYFQMRPFLSGPQLSIEEITPLLAHSESVMVRGTAQRVTHLTINDRPLFTDTEGVFNETLLLLPGYNILTIEATDRFGRSTALERRVYLQ